MPKVARISAKIPASTASSASSASSAASNKSDSNTFVSIALFSGIGLLVSLIAV